VDDVRAALVGPRGRDCEVARLEDRGDAVAAARVLDADAPGLPRGPLAADADVATGVHAEVARAGVGEQPRRLFDRPALHERPRVERAARPALHAAPHAPPHGP